MMNLDIESIEPSEAAEQESRSDSPARRVERGRPAREIPEGTHEKIERKLVLPGEYLGDGQAGHGTYVMDGKVYSKYIGMAEFREGRHKVIPLGGVYNPKRGDGVIGKITEIIFQKWIVDINSPYEAVLPLSEAVEGFVDITKDDLTKYFDYNDLVFAEIFNVNKQKQVQLTMRSPKCRKLWGGRTLIVTPAKVPRIIGKQGSMVEMIKKLTGTQIVVGQNGIVWLKGDNEDLAVEAITTIERLSHKSGLTDYIKEMLEKKIKSMPRGKKEEFDEKEAGNEDINEADSETPETETANEEISDVGIENIEPSELGEQENSERT